MIGALAGKSCCSCSVKSFSQLSRNVVSPAEQLGKQKAGAGDCLASDGSGGTFGGGTTEGGDTLAQPARNISSRSGVTHRSGDSLLGILHDSFDDLDSTMFLGAGLFAGQPCCIGLRSQGLFMAKLCRRDGLLCSGQAPGLKAEPEKQDRNDSG